MAQRTVQEYDREYWAKNKAQMSARRKRSRDTTLGGRVTQILGCAKQRHEKLYNTEQWNLDSDYIKELYSIQKGLCALTGEVMSFASSKNRTISNTMSLDRIDNSRGYVRGNVQLVTAKINYMRGMFSIEEFRAMCAKVANHG